MFNLRIWSKLARYLDKYLIDGGSSEIPNDLEEAAKKYATEWHENPDGSAWKPYFEVSAIKAFIAGAKWQKEQMLKDAVEGLFWNTPFPTICLDDCKDYNFKDNQRVRIIVCKKEG